MRSEFPSTFRYASRGLIALAATGVVLQLPGCGGGGTTVGAPLNPAPGPAAPAPLAVNPANVTIYVNQPTSLLVTGGVPPYRAFSSNPALLPVLQDVIGSVIPLVASSTVSAEGSSGSVTVTVTDSAGGTTSSSVTVIPSSFLSSPDALVIRGANCAAPGEMTDITCAGQTGTATVRLVSNTGTPLAGRQVRFEALQGQFSFVLDDTASQLSKTVTVTTDSLGQAIVRFRVDNNALTSFGLIRVTDLTTGSRLDKSFPIAQVTSGDQVLSVTPPSWKVLGPFKGECSTGAQVGYYIFGGSPPYRVVSSVPNAIGVGTQFGGASGASTTVTQNGSFFVATTLGRCILNDNPIIFITDATGRTVGVGLENAEGEQERPTAPPPPPPSAITVGPTTLNAPVNPLSPSTCTISNPVVAGTLSLQGGVPNQMRAVVANPSAVTLGAGATAVPGFSGAYTVSGAFVSVLIQPGVYPPGKIGEIVFSDGTSAPQTVTINCPAQ